MINYNVFFQCWKCIDRLLTIKFITIEEVVVLNLFAYISNNIICISVVFNPWVGVRGSPKIIGEMIFPFYSKIK